MKPYAAPLIVTALLTTAACNATPASEKANEHAQAAATAPAATSPDTQSADIPPPSAREILRAGWDGTERGSYDAQRNVFVERDTATQEVLETGLWHQLSFTSGDRRYFTGLTSAIQVAGAETGEPSSPVSLGQATFVAEGDRWRPVDSGFVGNLDVNATGNPAAIDPDQSRVPPPHVLPDGRTLFAIRMKDFAQGISLQSHAVLLFDPRGVAPGNARKSGYPNGGWSLVAMIPTGSDNAAACADGAVMPCAADSGTLRFEPSGTDLPEIRVQRVGSEAIAPGKVRQLGADDTLVYRFDRAQSEYALRQ